MSLHLAPLLSQPFLWTIVLVYLALFAWLYQRYRSVLARRYWWSLIIAKLVALALLVTLLLNPYLTVNQPDPAAYQVLCLVDATGSMQVSDCQGSRQRLAVINDQVTAPGGLLDRLESRHRHLSTYAFAGDDLRRLQPHARLEALPGLTDLDDALEKVLSSQTGGLKLGAILLISDGQDNRGQDLLRAAGSLKAAGVPVHTIGVGDSRERPDLAVQWEDFPTKLIKGKPFDLRARIRRNFTGELTSQVEIFEGSRLVHQQAVTFEKEALTTEVAFEHRSFTAGLKTFKVKAAALANEQNTLNNIAYAGKEVENPDEFKVLYFSGLLDWEYKFLNRLAENQHRLQLDALIRLGPERWYAQGFDEADEPPRGFLPPEQLNDYDAIVLHLDSLKLLSPEQAQALAAFVENRGGGLILTGLTDQTPPAVASLLPFREFPADISTTARRNLQFQPSQFVADWPRTTPRELSGRYYVPDDTAYLQVEPTVLKPAAVPIATLDGETAIMLLAQQYGAGKVLFINLDTTWQWVMNEHYGEDWYGDFWGHLITWSASSLQERLTIRPSGSKLRLRQDHLVTLDLLDHRYQPDNQADIEATVMSPDGATHQLSFIQDPRTDGRYTAHFFPEQTGEFVWRLKVTMTDGETIEERTDYVVVDESPEYQPAPMAEAKLQSLARITGGTYWPYGRLEAIDQLPIADQVRFREERHELASTWLFLIVILLGILPDWILRRRIGLR